MTIVVFDVLRAKWLKLPMSRINFHDPKDVQAIKIRLYVIDKC